MGTLEISSGRERESLLMGRKITSEVYTGLVGQEFRVFVV